MIKFTKRQINIIINACHNYYVAQMNKRFCENAQNVEVFWNHKRYLDGVMGALDITAVQDTIGSYPEWFHVYAAEVFPEARDGNGNSIEIMTIDAFTKTIIYDIFKETDTYSTKYAKQLKEGIAKYYAEQYGEQPIMS